MKKIITVLFLLNSFTFGQDVRINEIRANDSATDDIEFIELVGVAGIDLTGYKISHYNGAATSDGAIWTMTIGSFIIPDDGFTDNNGTPIGYYVLAMSGVPNLDETLPGGLQNGEDGIILYDPSDNIIDAVAWEGAGDLVTDDPGTVTTSPPTTANNYLHVTIDDDNDDNSLQAPNYVIGDDGSGWSLGTATPGTINFNQTSGSIELPVELTTFTASVVDKNVELNWETATEVNNYGFEIERQYLESSIKLQEWEKISFVEGHGNSNSPKYYSYTDNTLEKSGKYVYRLKQVDIDGTYEYSEEVEIDFGSPEAYELSQNYPNPFNPTTSIKYNLPTDAYVKLNVYNILGETVAELVNTKKSAGYHNVTFNAEGLNSGIYFYKLETNNFTQIHKMLLIK